MPQTSIIHNGQEYRFQDTESAQAFIDQIPSPKGDLKIEGGTELFQLLNEIGAPMLNWKEINTEICNEWNQTFTGDQSDSNWPLLSVKRVELLALFKSVMDIAELAIDPKDLEVLRDAREGQYKTFILQEDMVGENVCVETLYAVTERENRAGRMYQDQALRQIATDGIAVPHMTRAEFLAQIKPQKPTFMQKLKKFF